VSRTIAGYEILEELGSSVWGKSYRARQVSLDRPVLLTVLPTGEKAAKVRARARACAALTHAHLVSGIDYGEIQGREFLVTEWVEGPSIGEVVTRGGPIAEERVLEIALAAAHALDCVAGVRLIHGSITPNALVIAVGGNPKLRGFGADRPLTKYEEDYRSPEQRAGKRPDVRSDIWSLGAVLYYALTARYPFQDAPPAEVIDDFVVEVPFPIREANRKLEPETCDLVERMMSPRAELRPSSGADVVELVEQVLGSIEEKVRVRPGRTARPRPRRVRPARARRRLRRR
jgi:serine/threonine-protein kinase